MRSVLSPTLHLLPTFLHEDVVAGSYLPAITHLTVLRSLMGAALPAGAPVPAHSTVTAVGMPMPQATIFLSGDEGDVPLEEELDEDDLDEEDDEDDFDEIEEDIDEEDLDGLEEEFDDEEFDDDDELDDDDDVEDDEAEEEDDL
jgi:hypothetical protein